NYFFGMPGEDAELELTFNHDGRAYDLGTGYGHVAIGVDDLDATLERLAGQGIEPERPPYTVREGGSRLCFVGDPDGYRIELISPKQAEQIDEIEVGRSGVSGPVRIALRVTDSVELAARLAAAGAEQLAEPVVTPWSDRNVRLRTPEGIQLTLFTPLESDTS